MHGRTRLLALALGLACCLPAAVGAAPMPAGTYDVQLTNGTIDIGNGLLPALPLTSGTTFSLAIGSDPVSAPIGLTVTDAPFAISGMFFSATGTATITVTGAGATLNPATGSASVDASFFVTFSLSGSLLGIPASGTCSVGSQNQPISIHLTTDEGSAWDPAAGAFSMADNTFALPAPSACGTIGDIVALVTGSTNGGDNSAILNGLATRRPDPPVTNTPTTTTTTPTTPTTTTQPIDTAGNPSDVTPLAAPVVKRCVVPKLVGKKLAAAKKALKKAGCKTGKVKSKTSKKKKGRVLNQGKKAGKKLSAGAKVPLTVSKGPKKARKKQSR